MESSANPALATLARANDFLSRSEIEAKDQREHTG